MEPAERLAIQDLLARAALALDEHDFATLERCFAPEARLAIDIAGADGTMELEGRDAIMQLMRDSMAEQTDQRRHVTTNTLLLEDGGDEARLVSNLTLTAVEDGAIRLVTSGYYRDRVRRDGKGWLIAERVIELDTQY